MIVSFKHGWLKDYYLHDKSSKKVPGGGIDSRLFRKLQMIDDATSDLDLRSPPSNHFEKLAGNLSGKRSIRVNKQWRLIFEWDGSKGEAAELYLDNHSYR
ncbi:MAG: type II toxin-antitoxin system RelE/ParE family toxin [Gammaproteobacteria bacterium]|nr:type II toxin-antitoxin system RelE/ParE family toxin [Gammaproteobacteria bacterium]